MEQLAIIQTVIIIFCVGFIIIALIILKGLGYTNQKRRDLEYKNKYPHYVGDDPKNEVDTNFNKKS